MPNAQSQAMLVEILRQPEYVRNLAVLGPWSHLAGRFAGRRPVLTGCGTSFFAARLAAAHLAEAGRPVPAVQAFELLRAPRLAAHGDLIVALSHSGSTAAVLDLLARAREEHLPTLLITGFPESAAAGMADAVAATGYAEELSWCHTISFTLASLTALGVVHTLDGANPAAPDLDGVAQGIEAALARRDDIRSLASTVASATSVWLLGAGPTEPLAHEFGLKLCEAAYIPAQPLELEQFFHGYVPAMEPGAAVIAALPADVRTRRDDLRRVAEIVGLHLIDIAGLVGPGGAPVSAWAQAAALQLLTFEVSAVRGTDPDHLRREDPMYLAARRAYR